MSLDLAIALLITDHLDGTLDDAGRQHLETWLMAAAENRQQFACLVLEHQALLRFGASAVVQTPSVRLVRQHRRPASGFPYHWLQLAAAVLVAAIAGWLVSGRAVPAARPTAVAEVVTAQAATLERSGRRISPLPGTRLQPGDQLMTGNGSAAVTWDDGTTVRLASDTVVIAGQGLHLRVVHGRIDATVAPQAPASPAIFATTEAEVIVVGTKLSVAAGAGESAAEVLSGTVRVKRTSDGAELMVHAGSCVAILPGGPLLARSIGAPAGRVHVIAPGEALPDPTSVAPGDVLAVAAGDHHAAWRWSGSGTALRPIIIRGSGPVETHLDARGLVVDGDHNRPRAVLQIEGSHVVVENLELHGARNGSNGAGIRITGQASDVVIRNCHVHDCDQGVMSDATTGTLTLDGCEIDHNGASEQHGLTPNVHLAGARNRIQGCHIHDAVAGCNLKLQGAEQVLIANRIAAGSEGEIEVNSTGDQDTSLALSGNVIIGQARADDREHTHFIYFLRAGDARSRGELILLGNTLVAADPRIRFIEAAGCQVHIEHTIFFGSDHITGPGVTPDGRRNWLPPQATPVPGLVEQVAVGSLAPGFRAATAGDFILNSASPCRAAAVPGEWQGRSGSLPLIPELAPPDAQHPAQPRQGNAVGAYP